MPKISDQPFRLGDEEFGIVVHVLCRAMMGEMEEAEIMGRQNQDERRQPRHGFVDPAILERRAVNRFMQRREQEDQDDAIGDHRRDEPRRADGFKDGHPGGDEQDQVDYELQAPAQVRPLHELLEPVGIDEVAAGSEIFHQQGVMPLRAAGFQPRLREKRRYTPISRKQRAKAAYRVGNDTSFNPVIC